MLSMDFLNAKFHLIKRWNQTTFLLHQEYSGGRGLDSQWVTTNHHEFSLKDATGQPIYEPLEGNKTVNLTLHSIWHTVVFDIQWIIIYILSKNIYLRKGHDVKFGDIYSNCQMFTICMNVMLLSQKQVDVLNVNYFSLFDGSTDCQAT